MRYEWFIAKRYLRPQGGATFIFHLTLFSIGAVGLGVAALITVLSVMNGFGNDVRGKIIGSSSHIQVNLERNGPYDPSLIEQYKQIPNIEACAPVVLCNGLLYRTDFAKAKIPIFAFGIEPSLEKDVTQLDQKLLMGELDSLEPPPLNSHGGLVDITSLQSNDIPGIFIGKELAAKLFGVYARDGEDKSVYNSLYGQRVTLVTLPTEEISVTLMKPEMKHFRIVGVFDTGYYEYDLTWVYIAIRDAQGLTGTVDEISAMQIRLKNADENSTIQTENLLYQKNNELGIFGGIKSWMNMNEVFFEALKIEKLTMDLILKIIILVATFNIIATIFMIVMAKTRDIGLLRAIGSSRRSVLSVFLLVGIYIGIIGTALGIACGYGLCSIIQVYPIQLPGAGQVYNLKYLPCDMQIHDFLGVTVYTIVISFLAAIYPAIRASRLHPVEALRFD